MRPLFTIGYTAKPLRRFIALLREAGVDGVIDIRRHNTSQLAGFAKRDDLEFLLGEGFGIGYVHCPELAPTEEILKRYHQDKDWEAYAPAYQALIEEREMVARAREALCRYARPCLLCAEPGAERCHRRLLAEALAASDPDLEVIHLR